MSLECADMAYLLMLNEYLDVEEFITDVSEREQESINRAEAGKSAGKRRRGRG